MDQKYSIVEGVESTFRYHLVQGESRNTKALCGAQSMVTGVPIDAWGFNTHLHEKWCAICPEIMAARGGE